MTPDEIELFCADELGQKPGRGMAVASLVFKKGIDDFDSMRELNRPLRENLKRRCVNSSLAAERDATADDGVIKLLYRLCDGNSVEGVLIPGPSRLTLCVSTQVGCASGCGFCLTGSGGFVRNLATSEMVNQALAARSVAAGRQITNIVLMGTGEPLSNYEAVVKFVDILTHRHGMGYAGKKVTLSTCGLAPMIERMADDMPDVSLAVSLNAATDGVRDRIMPVNKTYPIARLAQALRAYSGRSGRSVTIEYVLLKGVNDSPDDAKRLSGLLEGIPCMINLLLFNPFENARFERPAPEVASTFRDILVSNGYVTVVRNSRGKDIRAACGQLRSGSSSTSCEWK